MATVRLPDDPNFEQLRKQAKDLRTRAGVTLAHAQREVAQRYGFASWARLKRHVETIGRYRRVPDEVESAGSVVDEFLVLACLRYGNDDGPSRWQRAARVLAEHPEITRASVHAAAAAADVAALSAILTEDPALAGAEGGPYGWEPILYLAFARHDTAIDETATVGAIDLLVGHGADPNAGYLWHGLTTPFTALTGALGSGEGDQPPHPHGLAVARRLLAAGADPNDGQLLYNRQFGPDDSHLVLLLEHGLGQGDGGPWRARLGPAARPPAELVRDQLWWAIVHDMPDRVRLLAEHGVDVLGRFPAGGPGYPRTAAGKTPAELAALCGCRSVMDCLVNLGAPEPVSEGADGLIAAALGGDLRTVDRLREYARQARGQWPGLIVWAAARHAWHTIPVLVELGFDVNARARTDIPLEQEWETALHAAAGDDELDGVRLLIGLGADPNIRDARFDATPLGWAEHFHHRATGEFLRPITAG